jgi:hypothetical protein
LKDRLKKEKKRALKEGAGEVHELVFHRDKRVIERKYMQRLFKRILGKAELINVNR